MDYLYCQNHECGVYLGSLGTRACNCCGWMAPTEPADCAGIEVAAREAIAAWKDCNHGSLKLKFIKAMERLEAATEP